MQNRRALNPFGVLGSRLVRGRNSAISLTDDLPASRTRPMVAETRAQLQDLKRRVDALRGHL
jgi:hypothetical protein